MKRLLATWRTCTAVTAVQVAGQRLHARVAARRDARAYAEVLEIVDTDEWLIALAGARSPRPHSDTFLPTSPAKDGS